MKRTCATLALLCLATVLGCRSTPPGSEPVPLFNGRDLRGWRHVLADPAVPASDVWSVQDGILNCKGAPVGYLYSERAFKNFRLEVEYRWAPDTKPGNSGLFSRIKKPAGALPPCVEVQLRHGDAGDLLGLQGLMVESGQPRHFQVANHKLAGDINGVKKAQPAERPPGEWNQVVIVAEEGSYTVWLNDQQVNQATGVEVLSGPIGLQSEGGEIQFRRVTVTPLP